MVPLRLNGHIQDACIWVGSLPSAIGRRNRENLQWFLENIDHFKQSRDVRSFVVKA
jgi:hypothetical protein